jgi:hypothetical protein
MEWLEEPAPPLLLDLGLNWHYQSIFRHKSLRSIEEVSSDMLKPEALSDRLIHEILKIA